MIPALRGVRGIDIGRRSVTGGAATPQRSLYAVPRDACPRDPAPTPSRIERSHQVIEPLEAIEAIFSIEVGTPSRPHPPFSAVPQRWPGSTDAKATICLRLRQQQVAESKAMVSS